MTLETNAIQPPSVPTPAGPLLQEATSLPLSPIGNQTHALPANADIQLNAEPTPSASIKSIPQESPTTSGAAQAAPPAAQSPLPPTNSNVPPPTSATPAPSNAAISAAPVTESNSPPAGSPPTTPPAEGAAPIDNAKGPAAGAQAQTVPAAPVAPAAPCSLSSLDLVVTDWKGFAIPRLALKVTVKKAVIFKGSTDSKGRIPTIKDVQAGSVFEIRVKRDKDGPPLKTDDEEGYKLAAIGKIQIEETYACLASPRTRFEFATEPHAGKPGNADKQKVTISAGHNQTPSQIPQISGNVAKPPALTLGRDDRGLPKATLIDGARDWFNRNAARPVAPVPAPAAGDVERVKRLIDFAEKQATWSYERATITHVYIRQMMARTFVPPPIKGKDGPSNSVGQCTKYVKIALWYANYGPAVESIGNNVSPAREMGPALVAAGFTDVTSSLPDGRWASPGDVIVYERKSDTSASGHIDIRTYDGYISDFWTASLPISKFRVLGIYRKHSDPLPVKRMKAFLMMIASRESSTIFQADGYNETYRTLPATRANPKGKFNGFDKHPFDGTGVTPTPSGAYGITLQTWKNYTTKFLELKDEKEVFSPLMQDRIAVAIMEQTKNALAFVRTGEIERAAHILAVNDQWSSLPGGKETRGFTVEAMITTFNGFLKIL
jgi:muramidase (phage lysozyme)